MKEFGISLRTPVSKVSRKLIAPLLLAGATLAMVSGSAEAAAAPVQA